jgi:hypothetical protein
MREFLLLAPLALGACATNPNRVSIDLAPPGATCVQSASLNSYISQPASAEVGARLMGSASARSLRWVPHGTAVTMEFNASRVTAYLDANGRIERVSCG